MENGLKTRSWISDLINMFPAFVFAFSILMIRIHQFNMPYSDVYWSDSTDTSLIIDLFSFWKTLLVLCAACLAVVIMIASYFKGDIRFKKSFLYIPAVVYVVFVLISLFGSKYNYFALRGTSEHFEGTVVLLAYIMMVFFLFNMVDNERRTKCVLYSALIFTCMANLLGVTQALGHDFLNTTAGQKLMTFNYNMGGGISAWDLIDITAANGGNLFKFAFTDGEVYQTVYNINYVPLYLSLLIPVSAMLFIHFFVNGTAKKKTVSVLFLGLFGLYLYNFFAANSASGYFGLLAIFIAALIIFHKELKKWIKPLLCLLVVLGLVMGLLADRWLPEIRSVFAMASKTVVSFVYADGPSMTIEDFDNTPASLYAPVDYVETKDKQIVFSINGNEIVVTRDDEHSSYNITDGEGSQLYFTAVEGEESTYQILDERFHDYAKIGIASDNEFYYIIISTSGHDWYFRYDGETFLYQNVAGKETPLYKVPHSGLIKDYSFGSFRGRIWATTIPMLKHYVIKGAGADCFTFAFPQNDYATLYNQSEGREMNLVTDKAHNIYMQYWVNTGLISLLSWLALVGFYLVGAVKSFRKHGFNDFCDFANGGIFCGIIGFLATAFFNDGSVSTMPMFYTMLGTGLAINVRDKWAAESASAESAPAQMPEI